jgi:hypothetical protein
MAFIKFWYIALSIQVEAKKKTKEVGKNPLN